MITTVPARVAAALGALPATLFGFTLLAVLACSGVGATGKKGVGLPPSAPEPSRVLQSLDVDWYYTWSTKPLEGADSRDSVPMVWGAGTNYAEHLRSLWRAGRVPFLLAFNEPDLKSQSDLPVDEALEKWPQLESAASKLTSPAPSRRGRDTNGKLTRHDVRCCSRAAGEQG
ncbi:MAG: glycosyl hydrolase [Hyphomicrobiales bacterium]